MAAQVGKARKKDLFYLYKVALPAMYALESENENANLFNCVQRGHQNSMEWMPLFLTFMMLGGIKYSVISSVLGVVYIFTATGPFHLVAETYQGSAESHLLSHQDPHFLQAWQPTTYTRMMGPLIVTRSPLLRRKLEIGELANLSLELSAARDWHTME
ncbi:hypothetical protein ACET3Z_027733 [Daucus carota]